MILRAVCNCLFRNLFLGVAQTDIKSDNDATGEVITEICSAWSWSVAFCVISNPELEDRV